MEMQMKSVREVYRKINQQIGNATQINKNWVPGPIQGQVGIGTMDFAIVVRFCKERAWILLELYLFIQKNIKPLKNSLHFERLFGLFWSPEAIKERSNFFLSF